MRSSDGATGYITRALDGADFCSAVEKLLLDPELRSKMSMEAHRTVQQRDWAEAGRAFWAMSAD